ncbi:MAG TPA: hotdog fold thioesterase [Pyrinomonadaceae bacterium]|nr:hotdog fold thioesterase [Pyrinomonadaceae bacterium]
MSDLQEKSALIRKISENELLQFLGVKIVEASAENVCLEMEVTPKVHQYLGIMNGGVSLYLAETAASIGVVFGSDLEKVSPVGVEINANHLRAVSRGKITVKAAPIFPGRTVSVWQIEIFNDRGKLICLSRCTVLLQKRPAKRADNLQ